MKLRKRTVSTVLATLFLASIGFADPMLNVKSSFGDILTKWALNLGWILVAAIGFGLGVALAIQIFAMISKDIDEWQEVKNGNMGVVAILVSIIIMVGVIVVVSIS